MNLRSVDLNLLTVFDAIFAERNLTRAADRIGMSQSAMSHALSRLRHVFKDPLFTSTGRGVKPTPRALQLGAQTRQILDMTTGLFADNSKFDYTSSDREYNLMLHEYGDIVILPRLVKWLKGLDSSVRIRTHAWHPQELEDALRLGDIDLCFDPMQVKSGEIRCHRVIEEYYCSLVRRDHPVIKDSLSLEQFVELEHVTLMRSADERNLVDESLRNRNLERRTAMHVHSSFSLPHIVSSTDMICTLPSAPARYFADANNLKILRTPLPEIELFGYIKWHRSADEDPGHEWIRNFFIAGF